MAEKAGFSEGISVVLEVEKDAIVIRKKVYDLESLLSQVTPHNLHAEIDTGRPVGREVW
jgi:antitoxin MazE